MNNTKINYLLKVRDKYIQKMKFFESKDILNDNHIKVFVKGLSGVKTFIADNNEMFEPVAIDWLNVYCECRVKFDENVFHTSVFYTTPIIIKILVMGNTSMSFVNDFAYSYFEILLHVPEHILGRIFIHQISVFKMLANKIVDCGVYRHQVTFLEILFRFFCDYRNYRFDECQQNTPDLVSNELFPNIKNEGFIELFLNMKKSTYDIDSRNFLNKLNRCTQPCKIFSIVAESIVINQNQLTMPILSNQSYPFWVDFDIGIMQISFSCKGEDNEDFLVANYIAKEDLNQLTVEKNATHLKLNVNLKSESFSLIKFKFDSNSIKIEFKFKINDEAVYLVNNVVPYYPSYLSSTSTIINELTPSKKHIAKPKYCQKIITPETIKRVNKYDTIVEDHEAEQQLRSKIIKYANSTANSFTFEQSFTRSSTSFNFHIFKDSDPTPVMKQTEAVKAIKSPVLKDITNEIVKKRVAKSESRGKRNSVAKLTNKNKSPQKKQVSKDNSEFDVLKSNGKPTTNSKRKLYTKEAFENVAKNRQSPKENVTQRKRAKPKKVKKLVNRVVPLQTGASRKRNNVQTADYTDSEILQIHANVDLINSGIQNSGETVNSVFTENEIRNETIQQTGNNSPSVYDFQNIRRVETKDEEFILNVISQVRSQKGRTPSQIADQRQILVTKQAPKRSSVQKKNKTAPLNVLPIQTSTPLVNTNKSINRNVSNSYRRYAKSKNSITKLGYNSNIDCIEPYTESNVKKTPQRPVRVQGFRQSKANIRSFFENDSSVDDERIEPTPPVENVIVEAEVHSSSRNNRTAIENNVSGLSENTLNKPTSNIVTVPDGTPNCTIFQQAIKQREKPMPQITIPKPTDVDSRMIDNERTTISIVKQTDKERNKQKPIISIPMPIALEEIKTEYIISVEDNFDSDNIDFYPDTQVNSEKSCSATQRVSKLIETSTRQTPKRKCPETDEDSEDSSDTVTIPKQNQSRNRISAYPKFNEIIPMDTAHNNNIIGSIQNILKSATNLNVNRRFSHRNELIRYADDTELRIDCGQQSKYRRQTIGVDTNVAQNHGLHYKLQTLINRFNYTLENELHVQEMQAELQNMKKLRIDKEKSLAVIVAGKKESLCIKREKIIRCLTALKQQENELKASYSNLFKTIESLTKVINKNRDEIWHEESELNQIKQEECNLANQLVQTIMDHSANIRDEIWTQYIIELGRNVQQHFYNRYL